MTLKVCFNNQIHKITKLPANFSTLLNKVSEVFGNQLPQNWTLQYLDSDNDRIMLKNQEDYENFLEEQQVSNSKKTVKIFVLTYEDIQNNTDLSSSAASESFEEITNEKTMNEETQSPYIFESPNSAYTEGPQDRVEIEEEIIEKPQPEPFDERLGGLIQERFATPVKEEEPPKRVIKEKTHQQKPQPQPQQPKKAPQAQPQARAQENKPKATQQSAERQQQQPKRSAQKDIFSELFGGFGEQVPSQRTQKAQETSRPKPRQQQPQAQRQQPQRAQPTVHREVQCNGCGMYPLTGIRYKCYECPNFDFCERCESTRYHPHEFMQFTKPEPERNHQYHNNRNDQYYGGRNSAYGRQPQYSQYREAPHDPFGFSSFASPRMSESYRPRTSHHTPRRSDFGFFPIFI